MHERERMFAVRPFPKLTSRCYPLTLLRAGLWITSCLRPIWPETCERLIILT